MTATPALDALPPQLITLADHALHARTRLDAGAWAYFSGGAADEHTTRANPEAWSHWGLLPRVLRPIAGLHTHTPLLGRTLPHPVLLAPVAYQRMAHADGEVASACAAAALGAGMVLSSLSSTPVEAVAAAMGSGPDAPPLWFQLYWQADRAHTLALVQRAQAAGCEALVLTVDAPCHGVRDRERRAGFVLPPGVHAVHLSTHHPANTPSKTTLGPLLEQAPTWADVQWLLGATTLPVILKGVLHPQDAAEAAAMGVAAVIVSNHGGRVLDTTPPTAYMLPRVADAVQGSIPLLVDGGIRRGTDVLKAIALGATAVLVGRPAVYGLANAGATGVAHVLRLLLDELLAAMALTGCASLADAHPGLLHPLQPGLSLPTPHPHH